MSTQPFVRVSGSGPTVICLHSSASSSAQWSSPTQRLVRRAFDDECSDSAGSGQRIGHDAGDALRPTG